MKSSSQRLVARFAASALTGLALTGAATGAVAEETEPSPAPPSPPPVGPEPAPPSTDIDAASLSFYTQDLRQTRPIGEVILLPREQALLLSIGEVRTASGCPNNLRGVATNDGMVTDAMLYDDLSAQQSAERGTAVCVYFVSSYAPPPPIFLGRRLSGSDGPVRADLVSRSDWG